MQKNDIVGTAILVKCRMSTCLSPCCTTPPATASSELAVRPKAPTLNGGTTGTPKCLDANIAFLVISDAMLNNTNTYFSFVSNCLSLRLFHEINAKTMQLDKLKVSAP